MDNRLMQIIEQGNLARAVRPSILAVVDDLQNQILNEILQQYRSAVLTNEAARGMIGELAGLERIVRRVDQMVREADSVSEEEAAHG